MNAALILSGLSLPLSCIQVPAFLHTKSPVSLCLPPSSCPLLFITSCGFFSSSLYYVYAVNFPSLYLCYPLHAPFSYSSYLTVMTAPMHFWKRVYHYILRSATLTPLCFFKINYPSNKMINSKALRCSICILLCQIV